MGVNYDRDIWETRLCYGTPNNIFWLDSCYVSWKGKTLVPGKPILDKTEYKQCQNVAVEGKERDDAEDGDVCWDDEKISQIMLLI